MSEEVIHSEIPPCPLCGSEYICVLRNPIRMLCQIQCWRLSCSFGKGPEKEDLIIYLEDMEDEQLSPTEIWNIARSLWCETVDDYDAKE